MALLGVPFGATLCAVARSSADLGLDLNGSVSDRAGEGVVEGVQIQASGSNLIVDITNNGGGNGVLFGDIDGNGVVNLLDVGPFVDLLSNGGKNPAGDGNGDGVVNLLDVQFFVDALNGNGPGATVQFIIEFLSRSN